MAGAVEIRLVGRPQILDDEGVVRPVRGHQSWALLARILMTERPLSRRELSAELFASAEDPLGALRWCLAGLRRALGSAEVLVGDPVRAALRDGTRGRRRGAGRRPVRPRRARRRCSPGSIRGARPSSTPG